MVYSTSAGSARRSDARPVTRSRWLACAVCLSLLPGGCAQAGRRPHRPATSDEPLVDLARFDPRIVLDIRYATPDNFLGRAVYPRPCCFVRESVAGRLRAVQDDLTRDGLGLKVFDGFRPLWVQREMWRLVPNPRYVADPAVGSRHNRGAAVDVTLVDAAGRELTMPTAFDDFSPAAHRAWRGGDARALANRERLERAMSAHGLVGMDSEWWHFDAENWRDYPIVPDGGEPDCFLR